jgi:hypothetical protein
MRSTTLPQSGMPRTTGDEVIMRNRLLPRTTVLRAYKLGRDIIHLVRFTPKQGSDSRYRAVVYYPSGSIDGSDGVWLSLFDAMRRLRHNLDTPLTTLQIIRGCVRCDKC